MLCCCFLPSSLAGLLSFFLAGTITIQPIRVFVAIPIPIPIAVVVSCRIGGRKTKRHATRYFKYPTEEGLGPSVQERASLSLF